MQCYYGEVLEVIKNKVKKVAGGSRWLPTVASLLTGLAFLNGHLSWLVLFGLVPFILYARRAHNWTARQILFDCCVAAFFFSLIAGGWTLQTEPSNWIGLQGGTSVAVKIITWLIIALCSGIIFGLIVGVFVSKLKWEPVKLWFMLPFVWALAELARSYGLAFLFIGPGSSLSPNWNFGAFGLAVASTPLAYIGRFIGLYGLSAVAIAVNITVYLFIVKRYKVVVIVAAGILVTNFAAWRLYLPDTNRTIKVAAVYIHNPAGSLDPWGRVATPTKNTAVLVLPEYSSFFKNPGYEKFAATHFGAKTIVITTEAGAGSPHTNDLVYYTYQTGFISRQSKTFLAPYGEYMPYSASWMLKTFRQQVALTNFQLHSQVQRGATPEHVVRASGLTVGGLACSGVLNLNEYRRLADQGADILTNSASLSLLETASLYRVQEMYQNRFHAIANAKPFVQSARSGEAYIISSDGKILSLANKQSRLITSSLKLQPKRTLYSLLP